MLRERFRTDAFCSITIPVPLYLVVICVVTLANFAIMLASLALVDGRFFSSTRATFMLLISSSIYAIVICTVLDVLIRRGAGRKITHALWDTWIRFLGMHVVLAFVITVVLWRRIHRYAGFFSDQEDIDLVSSLVLLGTSTVPVAHRFAMSSYLRLGGSGDEKYEKST